MDKEAIAQILQAGMLAPSSKNRQPWKFVVATESAKAEARQAMEEGIRREKKEPFIPDRLVDDYVGDKIPLWEKIMDRQGTVCCAWEKTAFEEGLKVGIRLMTEVYGM